MRYLLPSFGFLLFFLSLLAALSPTSRRRKWQYKAEALLGASGMAFFASVLWTVHFQVGPYLYPLRLIRGFLAGTCVGILITLRLEGSLSPFKKSTRISKENLKECLRSEVDRWSAKTFDALMTELADVVDYAGNGPDPYQVEVQLLERTPEYLHVSVAVDNGGWRAFVPLSTSFIVYRDGRVDRPSL